MTKMNCLLVQTRLVWADAAANRDHLESIVSKRGHDCDLIIFPETFTSGFLGDVNTTLEDMHGATLAWMKALARQYACVLAGSMAIQTEQGPANRFLWVQPDGDVRFYDKYHLFAFGGEDQRYVAGKQRVVFEYRGWRICPQICYDLRFPVWCRNRDDYDVLLFVANWPEPRTAAWTALLKARAIENQCYVIAVNRIGQDERGLVYAGASVVLDSLGETVLDLGAEEGSAIASLSLDKVLATRRELPFQADADEFRMVEK